VLLHHDDEEERDPVSKNRKEVVEDGREVLTTSDGGDG